MYKCLSRHTGMLDFTNKLSIYCEPFRKYPVNMKIYRKSWLSLPCESTATETTLRKLNFHFLSH